MERYAEPGLQNRLILLSDGEATAGITSPARLVNLSTEYSLAGYALSTIGGAGANNSGGTPLSCT